VPFYVVRRGLDFCSLLMAFAGEMRLSPFLIRTRDTAAPPSGFAEIVSEAILIVLGYLRCSFAHFKPRIHFLDERLLLFQFSFESVNFLLLVLHCPVLFQELV
jgi:hypothetical protein